MGAEMGEGHIVTRGTQVARSESESTRRRVHTAGGRCPWRSLGTATLAILLLPMLSLSACIGSLGVSEKHAAFHKCSSGDVEIEEVDNPGHSKYRSKGCGHEETYYCIVGKCRSPRILSVRHHAAEHKCKVEEISTEEPKENEFVTKGCGKTDRYRCEEVKNDVVRCDRIK